MRVLLLSGLIGLTLTCAARAEVVIRAPFVHVRVGRPIVVEAPFVRIVAGAPRPALPPPSPVMPAVPATRALTVPEFARSFQAVPGQARYEVVLVHPCTGRPVKVCFSLPGCTRRVKCGKCSVVFRYGLCKTVVLSFERDGQVRVR